MFEKYYCVKQHDITDCGAACLASISKQYGLKTSISKIREVAGTDRQGTNAYGLVKAAEQLGFSAKGVKGDKEAFFSEFPLPCIAHVVVDGTLLHYVVIHKITKKYIILADPAKGLLKITPEAFFGEETEENTPVKYQWSGVLVMIVPNHTFQTGDETKGLFQRFVHLLLPQKMILFNIFLASIMYTILGVLAAFYFKILIDDILVTGLFKNLHILSIGIILLHIFKVLLGAFRSHLLLYLSQKLDIALLFGYYQHILKLPMKFFSTRKVGEIISRFQDASYVRDALSGATLTIMIDTFMVVAGGIILYIQNAKMFLVSLLVIFLYAIIVLMFNRWYKKLNEKQMEHNAQLTSYMVETLNGVQTMKAYNAERKIELQTEKKFVALLRSVFRLQWVNNIQNSFITIIELVGGTVVIWIGACYVMNGKMTVGELVVFQSLLLYFLEPIKRLISLQPQMETAVVAAERLGEILDLEVEETETKQNKIYPSSMKGDIKLKNVTFCYGTREPILTNINMHIKAGERIALVGESGSGKTTLAKLLLHLYSLEKGEILIDDYNIKDIQIEALREKIAYIPQETFLFSGTIMENLTLGLENASIEDVIEAAKYVRAHDFINELPLRYDTTLEENGLNLSGGQRQRLAIARAILKKPDMIILDEATSHLDTITEKAIEKTLEKYSHQMTTITIAHRLSTVKRCDRIFVMEKGRIVEEGSHEELLCLNGVYKELYGQQ